MTPRTLIAVLCLSFSACSFALGSKPTTLGKRAPFAAVDTTVAVALAIAAHNESQCRDEYEGWKTIKDCTGDRIATPVVAAGAALFALAAAYGWLRSSPTTTPAPTGPWNPDDDQVVSAERHQVACDATYRLGGAGTTCKPE